MIKTLANYSHLKWLDVTAPDKLEIANLAAEYGLPTGHLKTCLDPEQMPGIIKDHGFDIITLRSFDNTALLHADTVQELTNKLVIYKKQNFVLTIHRQEETYFSHFCEFYEGEANSATTDEIVDRLCLTVLHTYDKPITHATGLVDRYEDMVFLKQVSTSLIEDLFHIKRRVQLIKRLLELTSDVTENLPDVNPDDKYHELDYYNKKLTFRNDHVLEQIISLLNVHLSLSAYRTNEVMRVLTIFSVFFMPLTFIVGIYGMNFKFMPELDSRLGYPIVWAVMVTTAVTLLVWFKRKGWWPGSYNNRLPDLNKPHNEREKPIK